MNREQKLDLIRLAIEDFVGIKLNTLRDGNRAKLTYRPAKVQLLKIELLYRQGEGWNLSAWQWAGNSDDSRALQHIIRRFA